MRHHGSGVLTERIRIFQPDVLAYAAYTALILHLVGRLSSFILAERVNSIDWGDKKLRISFISASQSLVRIERLIMAAVMVFVQCFLSDASNSS